MKMMWQLMNLLMRLRWIIDALKAIGCDSARSVLAIDAEDLVTRTDLEKETVEEVLRILNDEFED